MSPRARLAALCAQAARRASARRAPRAASFGAPLRQCLTAGLIAAAALSVAPAQAEPTQTGRAGEVRVLDKITGRVADLSLAPGQETTFGYLTVSIGECRYPAENPDGDAFIQVVIRDAREPEPVFSGWMIASSPAINPFDHPRYDVWAIACTL